MFYDYQYTFAAVFTLIVLLVLVYQRRSFASKSNRIFKSLIYVNLLAAATDIVTYATISYPERYPLWFCYTSNIIYLWLFGLVSMTFLRYVLSMLESGKVRKYCLRFIYICEGIEVALLSTTSWTKAIIYYDEAMNYHHGVLFNIMYFIPMILVFSSVFIVLRSKWRFSKYQRLTVTTLIVVSAGIGFFQIFYPKADVFHMICSLVVLMMYIVFENPVYYTYQSTRCLNSKAFYEQLTEYNNSRRNPRIVFLLVTNKAENMGIEEAKFNNRIKNQVADTLYDTFGRFTFCLAEGKYAVIINRETVNTDDVLERIAYMFSNEIHVGKRKVTVSYVTAVYSLAELKLCDDYIDHMLEAIVQNSVEALATGGALPQIILSQHEFRNMEDTISKALEDDSFEIMYQPISCISDGKYHSAEALLRLRDRKGELVSPVRFIPVAEKNGSIVKIGYIVLKKVCEFLRDTRDKGLDLSYIEVNLSPVQLYESDMADRFISILEEYDVNPSLINLELTESMLYYYRDNLRNNLKKLKDYGISFSIDDFGSGFASLDYLYRFPISIVKIDRQVLNQAVSNGNARTVFIDTINTIKKIDKKVVIEGAETNEMVELIKATKADYIQGYYYSRPLLRDDFISFIKRR